MTLSAFFVSNMQICTEVLTYYQQARVQYAVQSAAGQSEWCLGEHTRLICSPKFCSAAGSSLFQLELNRVFMTLLQSSAAVDMALAAAEAAEDCIETY